MDTIQGLRTTIKNITNITKQLQVVSDSLDPARKVILDDINQELVDNIHELSLLLKEIYNADLKAT